MKYTYSFISIFLPSLISLNLDNYFHSNENINGKQVKVFTTPFEDNRMQGYFHLTTKTQKKLGIKIRMKEPRAYFINYVPLMINNYLKCSSCSELGCEKIKFWIVPYKNTKRLKLLYTSELYNYIVILDENKKVLYIVTSFLIDEKGYLNKVLKEYNKYKKPQKNLKRLFIKRIA